MKGKHAAKAARRTLEGVSAELDATKRELAAEREAREADAKRYRDEIAALRIGVDKLVDERMKAETERIRGEFAAVRNAERAEVSAVLGDLIPMVRIDRDKASEWADLRSRIARIDPVVGEALFAEGNRESKRASKQIRTSTQAKVVFKAKGNGLG